MIPIWDSNRCYFSKIGSSNLLGTTMYQGVPRALTKQVHLVTTKLQMGYLFGFICSWCKNDMTCNCSRHYHEYSKEKIIPSSKLG